jgi:predicted DNA-binding ribbon-helix-helix protein
MKEITRTQTGVRLERRLLMVLMALATELDLSIGDLLEGIVLHAFEGKAPFSAATLRKIEPVQRA